MPVGWIISNDGKEKRQSFTARSSLHHIGGNGEHGFSVTAYGATEDEARENAEAHFEKLAEWINLCKGK
jgi:hypothetical protein